MRHNEMPFENWATSPINGEQAAHMKTRQKARRDSGPTKAEVWAGKRLEAEGYKFTREAIWRWRLYDIWLGDLGCAIEVDGPEHDVKRDLWRDKKDYERSGIVVLRVRNWNEDDLDLAVKRLKTLDRWLLRRERLGLLTKDQKKQLLLERE